MNQRVKSSGSIKCSIVVPVYNGQATIGRCVDSLLKQSMRDDSLEILVVDDASTDETLSILSRYPDIRIVRQPRNMGPAAARNRGALEASGEIIVFTDADCIAAPDWVDQMTSSYDSDPRLVGVKGTYRTQQHEITARFVQLEYEGKYDKMAKADTIDFIDTYSAAYRRSIFLEMGGFDTGFPVACAEDVDLSYRMALEGYRMVFNPKAWVYHQHPTRWLDYIRKKYKFAYWRTVAIRKSPAKAFKDSHTPLTQKLQLLLVPSTVLITLASFLSHAFIGLSGVAWALIILSFAPFMLKSIQRDFIPALCTPAFFIPRALVQSVAVLMGSMEPALAIKPIVEKKGANLTP